MNKIITKLLGILLFLGNLFFVALCINAGIWGLLPFYVFSLLCGIWLIVIGFDKIDLSKKASASVPMNIFCNKCGTATKWIAEYQKYWCDPCQKYL